MKQLILPTMNMLASRRNRAVGLLLLLLAISGCAVNPVTGQRELTLVSTEREIAIGRQQYAPAQQMQGGVYRTDAELTEYVNRVGQAVAAHSGVDLPYEFVVLNHSVPNAWALPGGKIAINRGLLTELRNEAELAAVLGHEVAHAAARHGAKRIERGLITQGLMIGTAVVAGGQEYGGQLMQGAQLAAGLLTQKYSRDAEREADFYGTHFMAKAGYDPYGAVTLQETFLRLSGERRTDFIQGLFASHPPSAERVTNNKGLVKRLHKEGYANGKFGQTDYARALQPVKSTLPAFAAYDEAQKLYNEKNLDGALAAVNKALSLSNREAVFHGLRGAIRFQQNRFADSITNFDRAIRADDSYFVYHLQRGLAHAKNKNRNSAKADLNRSLKLLPTSTAFQALGQIAESEGNSDAAKRYYAQASQGGGQAAQTALVSLVRLELPAQPNKYIRAQAGRDGQGRYILQVINSAPVTVVDLQIRLEVALDGRVRSLTVPIPRLGPGDSKISVLAPGLQQATRINAYPVAARILQ